MFNFIKKNKFLIRIRRNRFYYRMRQYFPQVEPYYRDDPEVLERENGQVILMDWPDDAAKPYVGLVRDFGEYPRWTKYVRFLENNEFQYAFYNIHASDWMEQGKKFDAIIGIPSSAPYHLDEVRRKYTFLERTWNKPCYPSAHLTNLYEDKRLETYLAEVNDLPFAKTFISYDKQETLAYIETLRYPIIHKIDPSSGSVGTELIPNLKACRKLVKAVFSPNGRKTHVVYFRQKSYIYLQEMIPNDGFDIRVIIVGNQAFGYYRKVPKGEFRASGMDLVEKRSLPMEAVRIAHRLNRVINSPQIVVDMLHGLDGQYHIIEYSPFCQMEMTSQLQVDNEPGVYIIDENADIHFEKGRFWVHELALKEYFINHYIPSVSVGQERKPEYSYASEQ